MKILHLASFNRWTGAAAPAFEEVEALRRAGADAHYGYVGGSNLEARIGSLPWTHAILRREQDPVSLLRTMRALRAFVAGGGFDLVHAHLAHDHWLARLAIGRLEKRSLVRTFHSRRTLRRDPASRWLLRRTDGICVNNATFLEDPLLRDRGALFTPPPVDERIFRPGSDLRDELGIGRGVPLLGFIGKVAPGRGFEDALDVHARVRAALPEARLLVVGRGPHRSALEKRAAKLGTADAVVWAGYRDRDLPEALRAPDVMLFTARGSDEGHRAIVEALACGTPVAAYPIYGVRELLGPLASRFVARSADPEALAAVCLDLLAGRITVPPEECIAATAPSRHAPTAERLLDFYRALPAGRRNAMG
ncbi:MAG: glycosyltransferase family 4 protein [Thermoanaerobaculia bacterium]